MSTRRSGSASPPRYSNQRDGSVEIRMPFGIRASGFGSFRIPKHPESRIPNPKSLVPVVIGLVRALDWHSDVVRLILRQLRQLHAEMIEVQPRHLFVEALRKHVDLLLVLPRVRMQLELRDHLIGERRGH